MARRMGERAPWWHWLVALALILLLGNIWDWIGIDSIDAGYWLGNATVQVLRVVAFVGGIYGAWLLYVRLKQVYSGRRAAKAERERDGLGEKRSAP